MHFASAHSPSSSTLAITSAFPIFFAVTIPPSTVATVWSLLSQETVISLNVKPALVTVGVKIPTLFVPKFKVSWVLSSLTITPSFCAASTTVTTHFALISPAIADISVAPTESAVTTPSVTVATVSLLDCQVISSPLSVVAVSVTVAPISSFTLSLLMVTVPSFAPQPSHATTQIDVTIINVKSIILKNNFFIFSPTYNFFFHSFITSLTV